MAEEKRIYKIVERIVKDGKKYDVVIEINNFKYEKEKANEDYDYDYDIRYVIESKIKVNGKDFDIKIIIDGEGFDDEDGEKIIIRYISHHFKNEEYEEVERLQRKLGLYNEVKDDIEDIINKYLDNIEDFFSLLYYIKWRK